MTSDHLIGSVYRIWGRSHKAVCKRHPHCVLFVIVCWSADEDTALSAVCTWLAEAPSCDEGQHWASRARHLREVKPVKTRK